MGSCLGKKDQSARTIDNAIRQEAKELANVKILLLGAGDSGKSTFLKQMKLLFYNEFSQVDRHRAIVYLKENMIDGMKTLLKHVPLADLDPTLQEAHNAISDCPKDESSPERFLQVKQLWQSDAIKAVYERRHELCLDLAANLEYFFDKTDDVIQPNFFPTNDDILHTRTKTTGVQETRFEVPGEGGSRQIHMIDVGGQKSERRKWLHHFECVDFVFYFSSLEGYCQKMYEDEVTNRLKDDLDLFTQLMKMDDVLQKKTWFVFSNKSDLFKQRLVDRPFNKYFDDIPPGKERDFDYCVGYIQKKFTERWTGDKLHFFTTCALDNQHIKKVFDEIHKNVLNQQDVSL